MRRYGAGRMVAIPGLTAVALALGVATAGPASASLSGANAALTRAPYLTDPTQTSVQVNWATNAQYTGVVEYGPPGSCTANSVIACKLGSPITVGTVKEYQNSVTVTGLSPGTAYCYRITNTGSSPLDLLGSNPSPQFTTLEAAGGTQPLTFDVLGDWGDTTNGGVNDGSLNVNQAGVDAQIAASGAQFAVTTGDLAYPGGSQTEYGDLNQAGANVSAVFGPSFWAAPGETVPLYVVSGNHGLNSTFITNMPEQASATASGGVYAMVPYPSIDGTAAASYPASYYAFSAGGVRFYLLDASWADSNTGTATGGSCGSACKIYQVDHDAHWTASSAEYQWLASDLAAHPGGLKFAFFHFPLHADNSTQPNDTYLDNTPGSTGSLEQLLHDNGVQLVFNGHAHIYQRNIATPGGVTSYVTGGGGAKVEPVSHCSATDAYALGWSYSSSSGSACGAATKPTSDAQVFHFLKVTVDGTTVTVTPVNSLGQSFDTDTYNFAPDSIPPSAPGNLTLTKTSSTKNKLSWAAATDNIGVSAYDIYRNGAYLATVGPGVTSYTDSAATAGASYTYQVAARDLAGNTASASVLTGGTADTIPPTAPPNLTATATGYTSVSLSWGASTDNVGVTGYTVLRNGTAVATLSGTTTSYADTGLTPGTGYTYQVTASDAVGNASQPSNTLSVTTEADTTPPTSPGNPTATSVTASQAGLSWTRVHRQRRRRRIPGPARRVGDRLGLRHQLHRHHGGAQHQLHLPGRRLRRRGQHGGQWHTASDNTRAGHGLLRRLRDRRPVAVDHGQRACRSASPYALRGLRGTGNQHGRGHLRLQDPSRPLHRVVGAILGLRPKRHRIPRTCSASAAVPAGRSSTSTAALPARSRCGTTWPQSPPPAPLPCPRAAGTGWCCTRSSTARRAALT